MGHGEAARPALIEGLLRPAAYPHAVREPVGIAETHVSWVLLTGEFAYKVKKPLALSFLDYSTLERRRHFCEEEVRLNRRFAPDLYLACVPIGGSREAPRVGAAGPALEYAVQMRQFDPRQELGHLVDGGQVTVGEIETLGRRIATIHATAQRVTAAEPWGEPDAVQRITTRNFPEIRALPEAAARSGALEALERWVAAEFARRQALMQRRRAAGHVRECHGDLHCGNVVRWSGELLPFDGIDFDPALRCIDVASDLAFLAMDLDSRGRPDLRAALLSGWLGTGGDCEALRLLPYYDVYRALVRAKVASLQASQATPGSRPRTAAVATMNRYLDCALRRTQPSTPLLLVTCGFSGSGKSWLSLRLAAALPALRLRSDVERKRLAGLAPLASSRSAPGGGLYTQEFTARTYGRLHDCARSSLLGGESIVLDAAYLRRAERAAALDVARECGADGLILHCDAPVETLRARVAERQRLARDPSEADVAVLERQLGFWEPFDDAELSRLVAVDTGRASAVTLALAEIRRRTGAAGSGRRLGPYHEHVAG